MLKEIEKTILGQIRIGYEQRGVYHTFFLSDSLLSRFKVEDIIKSLVENV